MTRTLLLACHIVAVGGWIGANFTQLLLTRRFAHEGPAVAAAWTRQIIWLEKYYTVIGAVIAVTGVGLVFEGDWSWSSGFIWVGVATIVAGAALGGAFFGPLAKRRLAALESGDVGAADKAQATIVPLALFDTALVVIAILAMVDKWQS